MIQLVSYLMLVLVNLMPGPESELWLGWALIGVIGLMFAANLGLMVVLNLCELSRKIYLYYLRWKARKNQLEATGQPIEAVLRKQQNDSAQQSILVQANLEPVDEESREETLRE